MMACEWFLGSDQGPSFKQPPNIAFAQSPTGIWPQAAIPVGSAFRRPRKRGPLQAAANAARWVQEEEEEEEEDPTA